MLANNSHLFYNSLMEKPFTHIGVLTSGGDSPGMNACVRAVVRAAAACDITTIGIRNGLQGLIDDTLTVLGPRDVSGIVHEGGTFLGTARCADFYTKEGRAHAANICKKHGIQALVIIGGDGSFRGGYALYQEHDIPYIGLPGTIDNDMRGTDFTIGFDTAINTAVDAIDKIRDTAESHRRVFFVEVMGRHCGAIALESALACGAEAALIPELPTNLNQLARTITDGHARGKRSMIVVVAEGDDAGNAFTICEEIKQRIDVEGRVCVLGHIQRGGRPTARDRTLAARLGADAVKALCENCVNVFIGEIAGNVHRTPVEKVIESKEPVTLDAHELAAILAT